MHEKGYLLLERTGMFDINRLNKLADTDIGVRIRIAWIGYVNDLYKKSLVKSGD